MADYYESPLNCITLAEDIEYKTGEKADIGSAVIVKAHNLDVKALGKRIIGT